MGTSAPSHTHALTMDFVVDTLMRYFAARRPLRGLLVAAQK